MRNRVLFGATALGVTVLAILLARSKEAPIVRRNTSVEIKGATVRLGDASLELRHGGQSFSLRHAGEEHLLSLVTLRGTETRAVSILKMRKKEDHFELELGETRGPSEISDDKVCILQLRPPDDLKRVARERPAAKASAEKVLLSMEMCPWTLWLSQPAGENMFGVGKGFIGDSVNADLGALVTTTGASTLVASREKENAVTVQVIPGEHDHTAERASLRALTEVPTSGPSLSLAAFGSRRDAWRGLATMRGVKARRIYGALDGIEPGTMVMGIGTSGQPEVALEVDANGKFSAEVGEDVDRWFAVSQTGKTSPTVHHAPGSSWELRLSLRLPGALHLHLIDGATKLPITARAIVRGEGGTFDPNFGPDYRGSGAGPIFDVVRGDAEVVLPAGSYRVFATKGIEWSLPDVPLEIEPGRTREVTLSLAHLLPMQDYVACDLHVHARPSFDSPVLAEDRVVSLVSAGIEFAVPTEHNVVGNYALPLALLGLEHELSHVLGVEVTTERPKIGHFGVFPMKPNEREPSHRHLTGEHLVRAMHARDPHRIVQVNHPRLPRQIGYFEIGGWKDAGTHPPEGLFVDFDSLEVYNGYDLPFPERVEDVMRDYFTLLNMGKKIVATGSSDSHRIQYQWAGYPRTMVRWNPKNNKPGFDATEVDTRELI
ncbi:MAG: hypothetical protein KBF88_02230, partial [Polyangiaceae bacterium]|nr:hypothetical protein [Polyangiaceae bacterium]